MPLREEGAKEEGAVFQNQHFSSTYVNVPLLGVYFDFKVCMKAYYGIDGLLR